MPVSTCNYIWTCTTVKQSQRCNAQYATWHLLFNVFPLVSIDRATSCTAHSHRPPEVVDMYVFLTSEYKNCHHAAVAHWIQRLAVRRITEVPASTTMWSLSRRHLRHSPGIAQPREWWLKWPEGKTDHSLESSAKVTNATSYSSIPLTFS